LQATFPFEKGDEIMKKVILCALVAGQLVIAAQPALAADFAENQDVRAGVFAGVRLRMPLGADPQRRGLQAGLTLAPTSRATAMDGRSLTRFGEGLELGFGARRPLTLNLAGTPVNRLGIRPDGRAPGGQRQNVSTLGWIAIGFGTLVVAVGIGTAVLAHEISKNDD
jgi:hypothetical protein